MIKTTKENIKEISEGLSNFTYEIDFENNGSATKELMELFNSLEGTWCGRKLECAEDYIRMYDDSFYTYQTWGALVESEKEQNDGMTEEECRGQIDYTIWRLPCGWYVQYV